MSSPHRRYSGYRRHPIRSPITRSPIYSHPRASPEAARYLRALSPYLDSEPSCPKPYQFRSLYKPRRCYNIDSEAGLATLRKCYETVIGKSHQIKKVSFAADNLVTTIDELPEPRAYNGAPQPVHQLAEKLSQANAEVAAAIEQLHDEHVKLEQKSDEISQLKQQVAVKDRIEHQEAQLQRAEHQALIKTQAALHALAMLAGAGYVYLSMGGKMPSMDDLHRLLPSFSPVMLQHVLSNIPRNPQAIEHFRELLGKALAEAYQYFAE